MDYKKRLKDALRLSFRSDVQDVLTAVRMYLSIIEGGAPRTVSAQAWTDLGNVVGHQKRDLGPTQ